MKLWMTRNEIKQRHRNGASIEILADLNNTSKEIIKDILSEDDYCTELTKEQKEQIFLELYKQGLTDTEMAEQLNMNRRTVGFWRERRNLPVNKRMEIHKKQKNLKRLIEILKVEPEIKNQDLANRLRVAKPTVEAYKTELRKKGILK